MGDFSISNQFGKNIDNIHLTNPVKTNESNFNIKMASVSGETNIDKVTVTGQTPNLTIGDEIYNDLNAYITVPNPATSQRMGAYNELLENGFSPLEAFAFKESANITA